MFFFNKDQWYIYFGIFVLVGLLTYHELGI